MYYYNDNLQIVEVMLDGGCTTTSAQEPAEVLDSQAERGFDRVAVSGPGNRRDVAIKRVCSWIFFVFKFIRLGYAVRRPGIEFTGFDNYIKMFHDPTIIQAIKQFDLYGSYGADPDCHRSGAFGFDSQQRVLQELF